MRFLFDFCVAAISFFLFTHPPIQDGQNGLEINGNITHDNQIEIVIDSPLICPPCNSTKELHSNSFLDRVPRNLGDKVKYNASTITGEHTSDTTLLLHQTLSDNGESSTDSSHWIQLSKEITTEGQETTATVAFGVPELRSQPPQPSPSQRELPNQAPPPPPPPARVGEAVSLEDELSLMFKVACVLVPISAAGIIGTLAAVVNNKKAHVTHEVFFETYMVLTYVSFLSSMGLFLLTFFRPDVRGLGIIVKLTMWVASGSVTYAMACAVCIPLSKSLAVRVLILVAPLVVLVVLALIFKFLSRRN